MLTYPLEDFLLTAEAVLGTEAEQLLPAVRLGEAESALAAPFASYGGEAFYPDPVDRAGILASRIVRNHPLPDGNKRTALLCMLDLLDQAGYTLSATQDKRAEAIERLAARELSESDFLSWLARHVVPDDLRRAS